MKIFFRLFVICFLAFAVVSCNQNSDTNPITKPDPNPDPKPDPNPDPKPDPDPNPDPDPEPDPETNGLDEIIATRQPGGVVEGKLSYSVEWSEELEFSYANQEVSYFMTGLKLSTAKGNSLKAIALIMDSGDGTLPLDTTGELEFEGIITEVGSLKVIRTLATLKIPVKGSTIDAQGALLLIDDKATMAEDEVRFVADGQFKANFGTPSKDGTFPFAAMSDDGKVLVGFGIDDGTLNFGEMESWPISYLAEGKKTAYGTVKQLTGFIKLEKGYGIAALAINLKQPKPAEKAVLVCEGCTQDTIVSMPRDSFTATDDLWLKLMPLKTPIPDWITGRSSIPLPKEPTCKEMAGLLGTTIKAANSYRAHASNLEQGASLFLVGKIITEYKADSDLHTTSLKTFQSREAQSWDTAVSISKEMEALKCFE